MDPFELEKRKELRHVLEAGATVVRSKDGHAIQAKTINMSGSGILLHFEEPTHFVVGEEVTCDCKVSSPSDWPLPYWGIGNVIRVEGCEVAIELNAGGLTQGKSGE